MSNLQVIRAWKDPKYRSRLSKTEVTVLPPHPAGSIDLSTGEFPEEIGNITVCSCACMTHQPCADSTITPILD
jgi:mersacidin/lichenicidin family type 2 lantibiotic